MRGAAWIANHFLHEDAWARSRLMEHAGKTLRFSLPMISISLRIGPDGMFDAPTAPVPAYDLEIEMRASALGLLTSGRDAVERSLILRGDTGLAQDLRQLADAAPWFFERELARWVGPIAAQRIADLCRYLAAWPGYAADSLGANLARYLTEERGALVGRSDARAFEVAVSTLRDDAARLQKRIERLFSSESGR